MSSHSLATKFLEIAPSIQVGVPYGRMLLSEVITLGLCAGGGVGATLLMLVIPFLIAGDPTAPPTPTPGPPLPF